MKNASSCIISEGEGRGVGFRERFVVDQNADEELQRRVNIHEYARGDDARFLDAPCEKNERY